MRYATEAYFSAPILSSLKNSHETDVCFCFKEVDPVWLYGTIAYMGTRLCCSQGAFNQIELDGRTGPVPTLLQCPERMETFPKRVQTTRMCHP